MNSKLTFELIWILITLALVALFILPIYTNLGADYPFYMENIAFIIIFISLTRFIFLTKYHWFGWSIIAKGIFIFLMIPIILYLVDRFTEYQAFLDEEGMYSIMENVTMRKQKSLTQFIKAEMVFNWVGAILSAVIMPFAMLRSIWLQKNRNRV